MKAVVIYEPEWVFSLEEIPGAHVYIDSSKSFGKVFAVSTEN